MKDTINNLKVVYKCDFKRNKECKKTSCQKECYYTCKPEYSLDGKKYGYNDIAVKFEEMDV
ncbi:MAG: hypothetical protein IJ736_05175 [Firmicutes bacterium]|nr:hypothetical protein [Bacillota bacterium]